MADDKVEIVLDGKDAGVVRAWLAAKASVDSFENSLVKIDPAQKRNAESARQFEKAAAAIFANTRTPLEKYEASLAELNELYVQNKVNSETYNRAVKQLTETLQKEDGTTAKLMATEKAEADAAKQAASEKLRDEAKVLADKETSAAKQERLEQQAASRSLARQRSQAIEQEKVEQQTASRRLAAQKAMFLEGQRLTDSVATAQERHNQRVATYRELLERSAISQTTFNRAVRASKDDMDNAGSSASNIVTRLSGMAAGYVSLAGAVSLYVRAQKEAIEDSEKAADKQDELGRRFRVQADLTAIGGEEARKSINKIAEDTATTTDDAFGAATALVSTGFDAKEAQGPALRAMLESLQAQQLKKGGVDAGSLAEAASKYLASQGKEKTGANLRELAIAVQGMKDTPLKITDLAELAKEGAGLKGKIGYKEQLANFAMLTETLPAGESATGLRNVAAHMTSMSKHKDKTEALREIGLKPGDVDLVGESFEDALQKIEERIQKAPEKNRARIKETLFEKANVSAYELLATRQDRVKELMAKGENPEILAEDFQKGATGRNAAKRRLAVEKETIDADSNEQFANTRQAYMNVMKEKGVWGPSRFAKGLQYDFLTFAGVSPNKAVEYTAPTGDLFGNNKDYANAVQNKLERAQNPDEYDRKELKEYLERTSKAADRMANAAESIAKQAAAPKVDVKVNGVAAPSKVTPPKPRPSAALGRQG